MQYTLYLEVFLKKLTFYLEVFYLNKLFEKSDSMHCSYDYIYYATQLLQTEHLLNNWKEIQ